jgi:hypothetical protein
MAEDTFACYREINEEKKKAAVQISLDRFLRKVEQPNSSRVLCTRIIPGFYVFVI